jgi:hypothetical protein
VARLVGVWVAAPLLLFCLLLLLLPLLLPAALC